MTNATADDAPRPRRRGPSASRPANEGRQPRPKPPAEGVPSGRPRGKRGGPSRDQRTDRADALARSEFVHEPFGANVSTAREARIIRDARMGIDVTGLVQRHGATASELARVLRWDLGNPAHCELVAEAVAARQQANDDVMGNPLQQRRRGPR